MVIRDSYRRRYRGFGADNSDINAVGVRVGPNGADNSDVNAIGVRLNPDGTATVVRAPPMKWLPALAAVAVLGGAYLVWRK